LLVSHFLHLCKPRLLHKLKESRVNKGLN
jgi:hypothetical protein